jgi:two-component system cell cycle sensor histidine kinase/response regulator CckA
VLVVDDQPLVRSTAVRVLERADYEVSEAGDGAEALALAERSPPFDLLLTDVIMPGLTGREVADALLARDPDLQVLFMSGYAGDPSQEGFGPRPGDAFLAKPFSPAVLVERVAELLAAPTA